MSSGFYQPTASQARLFYTVFDHDHHRLDCILVVGRDVDDEARTRGPHPRRGALPVVSRRPRSVGAGRALLRRGRARDGRRRPVAGDPRQWGRQQPQTTALLLADRPLLAALGRGDRVHRPAAVGTGRPRDPRSGHAPRPAMVRSEDRRGRRDRSGDHLYVLGQGALVADRLAAVFSDLGRALGLRGVAVG